MTKSINHRQQDAVSANAKIEKKIILNLNTDLINYYYYFMI